MWRVFAGAALVIAGIAAFIEAHSHRPIPAGPTGVGSGIGDIPSPASGLSQTAYDLLRIGGWALVIVGGLLVLIGLIGYSRGWRGPR
jgi:hypothetical protein